MGIAVASKIQGNLIQYQGARRSHLQICKYIGHTIQIQAAAQIQGTRVSHPDTGHKSQPSRYRAQESAVHILGTRARHLDIGYKRQPSRYRAQESTIHVQGTKVNYLDKGHKNQPSRYRAQESATHIVGQESAIYIKAIRAGQPPDIGTRVSHPDIEHKGQPSSYRAQDSAIQIQDTGTRVSYPDNGHKSQPSIYYLQSTRVSHPEDISQPKVQHTNIRSTVRIHLIRVMHRHRSTILYLRMILQNRAPRSSLIRYE